MAVFELGGALAPVIPELAIGPWTCTAPRIAAFDAGTDPLESRWRVDLARNDAASQAEFAAGERSVAQTHAVLDEVPRRLDRALDRAVTELAELARTAESAETSPSSRPAPARGDHSWAAAPELSPIEADLVAAITHTSAHRPPADSPGASPQAPGRPEHMREQTLEQMLGRVADLARGRARIETHASGALVAHSLMTLSGDTELWTAPRLSLADARLHARSVAVAIRTRHAWARILTLVVAGCGRILTLGFPAAGVSALPLVWRFVRDLLREVRHLNAAPRPAG